MGSQISWCTVTELGARLQFEPNIDYRQWTYNISIDKVGKSKHNKTLLRYKSQKNDNMFRPFYFKAIIRSDMEN